MPFGQIVIGPPGSGKTTYCTGMREFLESLGRNVAVVNLDPANDFLPYKCDVDIRELVSLESAMAHEQLGPNGGLVYCIEYLEANLDWLEARLEELGRRNAYVLFDCPGQVELYTHHTAVRNICRFLEKRNYRLCGVHLADAHYCSDPCKYVSLVLLSLTTMLHLELPHVNVLSKIDLIQQYGKLAFNLDFYTDVQDLSYLEGLLSADTFSKRYSELNRLLCGLIHDYDLVNFATLDIQDKASVYRILKLVDKANGYVFGACEKDNSSILRVAAGELEWEYDRTVAVQDKYVNSDSDPDSDPGHPEAAAGLESEGEATSDTAAGAHGADTPKGGVTVGVGVRPEARRLRERPVAKPPRPPIQLIDRTRSAQAP